MMRFAFFLSSLFFLTFCFNPSAAQAAATRIAFLDSFATGRGNAFAATADNPSAVFYNAAGLTQLDGTEVRGNVFAISLDYGFEGDNGANDGMDDEFQPVPSFFAAHRFEDFPLAVGFGAYTPFALGTDWGRDASFAVADPFRVPYRADLIYAKFHFALAWQVTDSLSLAIGPSFDYTDLDVRSRALEFEGEADTFGFSAALLWKPSERHAFGLNYQAKTDVTYDGTADVFNPSLTFDAEAHLIFPESVIFGYSYRPTPEWNLEFNLDWTNWDRVNTLDLEGVPGASFPLDWESAFIWELGVTRFFDNGWNASAGYTFVENAVPDAEFLPIVPDADRHFFGLGIGQTYQNLSWELTYQWTVAPDRTVSNNNSPVVNGDFDLESQALALSLTYSF